MRLQPMSFAKRIGFYNRGKQDKKEGVKWCPYTPNSTEAWLWQRGFEGKKPPTNRLVYMAQANQASFAPLVAN